MRKNTLLAVMTVFLAMLASSCIREKNFETYTPEPNEISFVLEGVATRSGEAAPLQVNTYGLGTDDEGHLFTLKETVMDMGSVGAPAETRGTPVFTENVQDVLGSEFGSVVYGTDGTVIDDGPFVAMADGFRWRRDFGFDPFKVSDPLTFFLHMPVSPVGVSNLTYNKREGSIAFDYTSPEKASDQQDVIFARRVLTAETYRSEYEANQGAALLFRHALTGVKFALSPDRNSTTTDRQPAGEVQTFITKVEFIGMKDKGHAKFLQDETEETYTDKKDTYSSASSFVWTLDDTSTKSFTQTFTSDDIQDFDQDDAADKVHGPESFYEAGQLRNLNKDDASLTFWFVPQDMTADVKLKVTFYVWDGESQGKEYTLELNLGEQILERDAAATEGRYKSWKAGQLRTFTLDPTLVDVSITDEVSEDHLVKSDVQIRNTGNKDAYIRVAIVGNWVDRYTKEILMGIPGTDPDTGDRTFTPIDPWSETDTAQGTFEGLGGSGAWVRQDDGFWYFKQAVPAGKLPGETATGGTHVPLFISYTRTATAPIDGTELKLDLIVQAVDAAAGADWEAAWATVL